MNRQSSSRAEVYNRYFENELGSSSSGLSEIIEPPPPPSRHAVGNHLLEYHHSSTLPHLSNREKYLATANVPRDREAGMRPAYSTDRLRTAAAARAATRRAPLIVHGHEEHSQHHHGGYGAPANANNLTKPGRFRWTSQTRPQSVMATSRIELDENRPPTLARSRPAAYLMNYTPELRPRPATSAGHRFIEQPPSHNYYHHQPQADAYYEPNKYFVSSWRPLSPEAQLLYPYPPPLNKSSNPRGYHTGSVCHHCGNKFKGKRHSKERSKSVFDKQTATGSSELRDLRQGQPQNHRVVTRRGHEVKEPAGRGHGAENIDSAYQPGIPRTVSQPSIVPVSKTIENQSHTYHETRGESYAEDIGNVEKTSPAINKTTFKSQVKIKETKLSSGQPPKQQQQQSSGAPMRSGQRLSYQAVWPQQPTTTAAVLPVSSATQSDQSLERVDDANRPTRELIENSVQLHTKHFVSPPAADTTRRRERGGDNTVSVRVASPRLRPNSVRRQNSAEVVPRPSANLNRKPAPMRPNSEHAEGVRKLIRHHNVLIEEQTVE